MTYYNNSPERSVYSVGASDGLWTGLAMGACVLCMVLSTKIMWLSTIGLALFVATPYLAWRLLRRGWVNGWVPPTFSAVWLHGICMFLFGGLIMALIMYVSIRFVVPGWIELQTRVAIERLEADPTTLSQARILNNILETGQLPSAIYTAVSSIWLVAFTGSLWSMVFAFILARTRRFRQLRAQHIANQQYRNE